MNVAEIVAWQAAHRYALGAPPRRGRGRAPRVLTNLSLRRIGSLPCPETPADEHCGCHELRRGHATGSREDDLVKSGTYPDPPVGAIILDRGGQVAGVGVTQPNGGGDAELVALRGAGRLAAGGTAVETGLLREWLHKQRTGLPHVTWKYAASVDGRSAAADGSSQWISSAGARADVHRRRAAADAHLTR